MKKLAILLLISCSFTRCFVAKNPTTSNYPREPITESLFAEKGRTISEDDIKRLLEGHLVMPETLRVAVFRHGMNNRFYSKFASFADEGSVRSHQNYMDTLISGLKTSPRVYNVNPIPTVMLSHSPTITQLREASVRLLSDMLIVYSTTSDIYYKWKAFKKDEAKAFATTEAFVMDTRTGLIPFTTTITKEFLTKTLPDETLTETQKRAEIAATTLTLEVVGLEISQFLAKK